MGLVVVSPQRIIIEKSLRLGFSATNNKAEYEAFLEGMFLDSMLVIGQVNGGTGGSGCENARIPEPS